MNTALATPESTPGPAALTRGDVGAEFAAMASQGAVRVTGLPVARARDAIAAAIAEVHRIERKYSRYRADSVVTRINVAAGIGDAMEVDDETAGLIDFAAALFEQSDGRFDITSGVLRRAWDFRSGRLPEPAQIAALLRLVGWRHVAWRSDSAKSPRIALTLPGMELDFGGFGKEYAADRAAAILAGHGASGGFVNLGGDIRVIGPDAQGMPWRFGIQHPREAERVLGTIHLASGALATSGDYERFMHVEGRRYCHILDPRSGWPVDCWQSVSVGAPVCLAAGALTTTAMLAGEDAAVFLESQGAPFFAVSATGEIVRRGI
jgi:thiamine biosynthesis lipoprotein